MSTPARGQFRETPHIASRVKQVAAWAAIAALVFTLAAPAQAQSRLAMTMLKPPLLGVTDGNLFIDGQDRVLGFAGYFKSAGYALDPSGSGKLVWVTTYNSYLSTWPASTAASVSSAKLFPNVLQTLPIDDVSPDGSKILVKQVNYKPIVYDAASKLAVAYPGGGLQEPPLGERSSANAVNGKGWSAGFAQLTDRTQAMRWRLSQAETLQTDTNRFVGSEAKAINASGEVAGEVNSVVNNSLIPHAAVWDLNGSLRVLDQTPGHLTRAAAIADNGTVLVERAVLTNTTPVGSLELHANDQITVLTPPAPGGVFAAMNKHSLSADGSTVVGSWVTSTPGQSPVMRAFIHTQGLTQDLTDLAKAKGVKLPTGAYFSAAAGVNAKGSVLATYVASTGLKPVQVRLTLAP